MARELMSIGGMSGSWIARAPDMRNSNGNGRENIFTDSRKRVLEDRHQGNEQQQKSEHRGIYDRSVYSPAGL